MILRRVLKILIVVLFLLGVAIAIISKDHPIILKWITGSARIVGKPIKAKVYTNGRLNEQVNVFHVKKYWDRTKANYYILNFQYADTKETKEVISLDILHNTAGIPSASNIRDYDMIGGVLFQSEVGSRFTDFTNSLKGYGFNPEFRFSNNQIRLNLPPKEKQFKCDSLRIVLEESY